MYSKNTRVYVGWDADNRVSVKCRPYRCRIGVIQGGPFSPEQSAVLLSGRLDFTWYHVRVVGADIAVAKHLLFPFHDPATETETTEQDEVAV